MSNTVVAFDSTYGSTKQYAEELASCLGVSAVHLDHAAAELDAHPDAALIVLSPVHGPMNAGARFISDTDLGSRRVALCTVGMTLDEVAVKKDSSARALGNKADRVTRFYLPGRLHYSELSTAHRTTMWTVVNMLKAKPMKNANDKMMIETFDTDVDRVDHSRLDQVVDWARGGVDKHGG